MTEVKSSTANLGPMIVLFPGYKCDMLTWTKIVEKDHPRKGEDIEFLSKLSKLPIDMHFASISWTTGLDVEKYIIDLGKILAGRKLILVGHSLGMLFCYLYAKKYKEQVLGCISIDGCYLGTAAVKSIERIKTGTDADLKYFANFIPIRDMTMPVNTICFRNLKMVANDRLEYTDETKLKKYTVKHYVQLGHYLHAVIPDEIIASIAKYIP